MHVPAPNAHAPRIPAGASTRILDVNHGLFVHYVPRLTVNTSGEAATMAAMGEFDVARFV